MRALATTTLGRLRVSSGLLCQGRPATRKQLSTGSSTPPPSTSRPSGFAPLSSRRLIALSGPDAARYLQGVITASVASREGHPRTPGFYTAFLSAQGRVLYDVFIYPNTLALEGNDGAPNLQENFLVEVDANEAEKLTRHIKRYKLRAKFSVRLLPLDEVGVWQVWGDPNASADAKSRLHKPGVSILLQDPRTPGLGHRFLALHNAKPQVDLEQRNEENYRVLRYLHGVAEGQNEIIHEQALPLESNMDITNGIDFQKGCYVGQELTYRSKYLGVVRKRILPCVIYDELKGVPTRLEYQPDEDANGNPETLTGDRIPLGTDIGRVGQKRRSAGRWLAGIGNIGLALCRLEIMTDMVLPGEASSVAFNPLDEFKLTWKRNPGGGEGELEAEPASRSENGEASEVRVKAFVPEWLRQRLDGEEGGTASNA